MIFTKVKLDNIFMFKNFEYDLTYPRKLTGKMKDNIFDGIYPYGDSIKYRKVNLIVGANASGKTTFGKALNLIQNILIGRTINIKDIINDKNGKALIEVDFLVESYLCRYSLQIECEKKEIKVDNELVSFENEVYSNELLKIVKINDKDNYVALQDKLNKEKGEKLLNIDNTEDFKSYLIRKDAIIDGEEKEFKFQSLLSLETTFNYMTSSINDRLYSKIKVDTKVLEKILCAIDNSVDHIQDLENRTTDEENSENIYSDYRIHFKNGDSILIEDGDVSKIENGRLSSGTVQAILMADILSKNELFNLKYLDEKMCNMHSELENAVIIKLAENTSNKQQIFITTHSESVLDLMIPIHAIALFKREEFITMVDPSIEFKKNDRSLLTYIKNDYFGTYPAYNEIWNLELGHDKNE